MDNKIEERLKELGIYEHILQLREKAKGHEANRESEAKKEIEYSLLPKLPNDSIRGFSPEKEELKNNYIYVYPTSVDEVKQLAGVSHKIARSNEADREEVMVNKLKPSGNMSINDLAYRYLIVSEAEAEEMIKDSGFTMEEVKQHILSKSKTLPVLCAGGILEVKDGETCYIEKTAVAVFDTVIIHGKGTIKADSNTKISILNKFIHD